MLYALLTSLPWLCVVVLLVRSHRQDVEERNQAQAAERAVWADERRELLNRVQAPGAAQKQAALEVAKPDLDNPPYVPWEDDDAFHEARRVTDG